MHLSRSDFFQVAWIVDDIDAAVEEWIGTHKVGPFFVARDLPLNNAELRGKQASWLFHAALAQAGDLQIEFIQPLGESPYAADQNPSDIKAKTVNHFARVVEDLDAAIAGYQSRGCSIYIRAAMGDIRYAYMDTKSLTGSYTEIIQAGKSIQLLRQRVADAAEGWNGTDPFRSLLDLL